MTIESTLAGPASVVTCQFLQDCDQFQGIDGAIYPPGDGSFFTPGDITTLPVQHADVLMEKGVVEILPEPVPYPMRWQHPDYPDVKIAKMSHTEICDALHGLQALPNGYDLMNEATLREMLKQVSRDEKVHQRFDNIQRARAEEREQAQLDNFIRRSGKGTVILEHGPIANHLHEKFHTVSFNKMLYIYDEETGIYRENSGDLEQEIRIIIEETGAKCSITRDTRDILAYLLATNPQREYPFNKKENLLPLNNGILKIKYDTDVEELLQHSPEQLFTYRIPVTYDTRANGNKARDLLQSWVEPEDVPILIQIAAQAVLQAQLQTTYKKSYIIQGEPHAGKSTYIEFLTGFFGNEQISSRSLQSLCNDRFVAGDLEGKMLNIYDDLSEIPLENVGTFKAFTGSCHHNVERKARQSYKGVITCPHVFTCNRPPKYPDDVKYDAAFWERWEYVRFPYSHEVDDTFNARTFTDIMYSGFLNLIIAAMFTIRKKTRLTMNRDADEVMERWSTAADPLYQFIRERMTENVKASDIERFDRKKLFEHYRKWCDVENIDPRKRIPTQAKFTRDIQGYKLTPSRTSKKIDSKKHTIDVYQGPYTWNGPKQEIEPEVSNLLDGG